MKPKPTIHAAFYCDRYTFCGIILGEPSKTTRLAEPFEGKTSVGAPIWLAGRGRDVTCKRCIRGMD